MAREAGKMAPFALTVAVSALLAGLLTPVARGLALRAGVVDAPGGRRRHAGQVARGGGMAIGVSFLVTSIVLALWIGREALVLDNPDAPRLLSGLVMGAALALAIGWTDDLRDLSARAQLAGQIGLALVAIGHRLWLQLFANPLTGQPVDLEAAAGGVLPGLLAVGLVTVVWYTGMINTLNWLDGVNGLAATVGALAALLFAVHMVTAFDQTELALFPLALAGACLGFLPWNVGRARVFMGSSGTMFLGFSLAALALIAPAKVATALLVLGVPIVDVAWQIAARARSGRAPWEGDRGHLHHRLYDRGWSPGAVVLLYAALSLAFGLVAVLVPQNLAGRGAVKLAALAVLGLGTLAGLWHLARDDAEDLASGRAGTDLPPHDRR